MEEIKQTVIKYKTKDGSLFSKKEDAYAYEANVRKSEYLSYLSNTNNFTVTEDHLKLIQRANIIPREGYPGNFTQDSYRPYGNSVWVFDIANILGIEPDMHDSNNPDCKWFSDELEYTLWMKHADLSICVEILCKNLSIVEGEYERDYCWEDEWRLC